TFTVLYAPNAMLRAVSLHDALPILLPSVTLLDRYIGQTYLRVFAVAFVGMLALFYIGLFTDYSEYLFKNQVSGSTMMRFFAYSRSEEHTSELYHVKISYAVFCLKKK